MDPPIDVGDNKEGFAEISIRQDYLPGQKDGCGKGV